MDYLDTKEKILKERRVCCRNNLISGGWKAKGLELPAQCVLLDVVVVITA